MKTLNIMESDPKKASNGDGRKKWENMIIDALIIGGIALLSTLSNEIPGVVEGYIALKAFGLAFLLQIAVERGIKKPQTEEGD